MNRKDRNKLKMEIRKMVTGYKPSPCLIKALKSNRRHVVFEALVGAMAGAIYMCGFSTNEEVYVGLDNQAKP